MNTIKTALFALGLVLTLGVMTGCASSATKPQKTPTAALQVQMVGGGAPSKQQLATVHKALEQDVARRGYTLAKNSDAADYLMLVHFWPVAGTDQGKAEIVGVERNNRLAAQAASNERLWDSVRSDHRRAEAPTRNNSLGVNDGDKL